MKPKSIIYDSMRAAAAAENLPFELIQRAKKAGCSAFKGGRVHASGLRRFLAKHRAKLEAGGSTLEQLRIRESTARCARIELRNAKERGEVTDTAKLVSTAGPLFIAIKAASYQALEISAPTSMAGLDVASARIVGRRLASDLLRLWQSLFRTWDTNVE